jgi:hypothetical protein
MTLRGIMVCTNLVIYSLTIFLPYYFIAVTVVTQTLEFNARHLLDDGGSGGGGDGGGGGGDDSAALGAGTAIAGASAGCRVRKGRAVAHFNRCVQFSLRGTAVQLAYSVKSRGRHGYLLNGALVIPKGASNQWFALGIPPNNGGRMVGTNAVVVQSLAGGAFTTDFHLGGYSFNAFTVPTGFIYKPAKTLTATVTSGNTLSGTFSIIMPSSISSMSVLIAQGPMVNGTMRRHNAVGRATINGAVSPGRGRGPMLNRGRVSGLPSKPSPVPSKPSPVPSTPTPVPSKPSPVPSTPNPVPSKPSPVPSTPTPVPSGNPACSLTVGSSTKTYTTCYQMKDFTGATTGTAYYSLSGNTLSVGYKSSGSPGWVAWGYLPSGMMMGGQAVFSRSGSPATYTMNGFAASLFSSATVKFANVKSAQSSGSTVTSFDMPWPSGQSSITVAMASGSVVGGAMQVHPGVPVIYTLSQSLKQA